MIEMIKVECLVCKKSFDVYPSRFKNGQTKYCSRACQHIAWGKRVSGKNHPMWKGGKIERICKNCNKIFHIWPYMIKDGRGIYCSKKCNNTRPGERNNFWKGGRYINEGGYIMTYQPKHPDCNKKGYIREHRFIMENIIGRYLLKEEVIHHINGITTDNRPENLMLFPNNSEHHKYHHLTKTLSNSTTKSSP